MTPARPAPRDPDGARRARDIFAAELERIAPVLTRRQRKAIGIAAEVLWPRLIEAHLRGPYPPEDQRQEAS